MEVGHFSDDDMKDYSHFEQNDSNLDITKHDNPGSIKANPTFSEKRAGLEDKIKLATRLVERFQGPDNLKKELIDFIITHHDITFENSLSIIKEAALQLHEKMRDSLENSGLIVNYDGSVDIYSVINKEILKKKEVQADLKKYQEFDDFNYQIQIKTPFASKNVITDNTVLFEVEDDGTLKKDPEPDVPIYRENIFDTMLGEENGKNNPDIDLFKISNPENFKSILKPKNVLESLPKTEAEQEEENGKIIFQVLEQNKFSTEIEDVFATDILKKNKQKARNTYH